MPMPTKHAFQAKEIAVCRSTKLVDGYCKHTFSIGKMAFSWHVKNCGFMCNKNFLIEAHTTYTVRRKSHCFLLKNNIPAYLPLNSTVFLFYIWHAYINTVNFPSLSVWFGYSLFICHFSLDSSRSLFSFTRCNPRYMSWIVAHILSHVSSCYFHSIRQANTHRQIT